MAATGNWKAPMSNPASTCWGGECSRREPALLPAASPSSQTGHLGNGQKPDQEMGAEGLGKQVLWHFPRALNS